MKIDVKVKEKTNTKGILFIVLCHTEGGYSVIEGKTRVCQRSEPVVDGQCL